jgi:hypothetical protein
MDLSISVVTPDMQFDRGAQAYDEGRGVHDHYMNPGAPAIRDWQYGWHTRRVERSRANACQAAQRAAEAAAS